LNVVFQNTQGALRTMSFPHDISRQFRVLAGSSGETARSKTTLTLVGLTSTLYSYQNSARTIPKTDFLSGDRVYFAMTAISSKATIIETTLSSASKTVNNAQIGPSGGPAAIDFQYENGLRTGVHPTITYFDFILDSNVFHVATDRSQNYEIAATLNVVFQNTQGALRTMSFPHDISRQFRVLAGSSGETARSKTTLTLVGLTGPDPEVVTSPDSSSSALSSGAIAGIVIAILAVATFVAAGLFLYRKKRNATPAAQPPAVVFAGVISNATNSA